MRIVLTLFLAVMTCSAAFAAEPAPAATSEAPPQLRGLLAVGSERQFSLVTPGRSAPQWVKLGGTFDGWELAEFKAAEETLVLKKGARTLPLRLEGGPIANAPGAGAAAKATIADAEEVFRKMDFERMMSRMLDQMKTNMATMTRRMGGAAAAGSDPEAAAALQKKTMDVMFEAMDIPGMKNDMVRIYSETFTRDELRGLSDFYGTAAGQAMVDKQPEIAQKMNELMMPRMMAAMPKIQAMAKEFAAEQAAKRAATQPAPTPEPAPTPATAVPAK